MAKLLKRLQKLYKKYRKLLWRFGRPLLAAVMLFLAGVLTEQYLLAHQKPTNIVWAVDNTVQVPSGLKKLLLTQDGCKDYRGLNSPKGVGLWAVTQVEQGSFAKLAYGCSWTISDHAVAVKQPKGWLIIAPEKYFSNTTEGVPTCAAVVQYKVPLSLEGFCMNDAGQLTKNPNPQ